MNAQGTDAIWWRPMGLHRGAPIEPQPLIHSCPTAVVATIVARDMLDPMAQGVCRYCGEAMP